MAGRGKNREIHDQDERIVPSLKQGGSRVSNAAGSRGSANVQSMRGESRSAPSRSGARNQPQASGRQSPRGRQNIDVTTPPRTPSARRNASPGGYRSAPSSASRAPRSSRAPAEPKDTQFVRWLYDQWDGLAPYHKQRVYSVILLILSLLLLGSLTVFSPTPLWTAIKNFFLTFFGWAAYVLAAGMIAFAITEFVESIRRIQLLRWTFVGGILLIILLVLVESRLIMGKLMAGVLAELIASPMLSWPVAVQHITVLGLLIIVVVFTFRITFGHVMMLFYFVQHLTALDERKILGNQAQDEYDYAAADDVDAVLDEDDAYQSQRPQYSRYGAGRAAGIPNRQVSAAAAKIPRMRRRTIDETMMDDLDSEEEDIYDESTVEFSPDFHEQLVAEEDEDEDDPLNDINIHQQQISRVPRNSRAPRQFDVEEHKGAVRNVNQQPLSYAEPDLDDDLDRTILDPSLQLPVEDAMLPAPILLDPGASRRPQAEPLRPVARSNKREVKESVVPAPARGRLSQPQIASLWKLPMLSLLSNPDETKLQLYVDDTTNLAHLIQDTLRSFRVDAEVREEDISIGPTVIRFGIRPTGRPEMIKDERTGKMVPVRDASGQIVYETRTRVSRIMALQNDLALVLESKTIRMEAPVPGRPYVGVEIPNKNSRLVSLREVLESKEFKAASIKSKLAIGLGKDVAGLVRIGDLARMPHLLIAGATGAGKSVCINTIIGSILMQATPDDVRLLMVDPKMVELNMYNGIPHLLSPVVIEVDKVVSLLKNAINEMEHRYRVFSKLGVRNLDGYRKMRLEKIAHGDTSLVNLPAIVIIIDELADLMMAAPEEVEGMICRLAQLARATGIHLVVATQRPSVDVITGLIKANIPTRISFMVSSAVDSRTIIDMGGAERLLGRGDMLYLPADAGRPERVQGAFLSDDEAQSLADYWRQQVIDHAVAVGESPVQVADNVVEPGWELKAEVADEFELEDDLLEKAEEVVREYGRASISLLQRRLRIGYSRAARLIDLLEQHGIIGRSESGGRAREVYDNNNGGSYARGGEGTSVADEVADIVAEEKARNEFLRKQATRFESPAEKNAASRKYHADDEDA